MILGNAMTDKKKYLQKHLISFIHGSSWAQTGVPTITWDCFATLSGTKPFTNVAKSAGAGGSCET